MKKEIKVTTGDIKRNYEILGPVFFQTNNKGLFGGGPLKDLKKKHADLINQLKADGQSSDTKADWGFLIGEWNAGQNDFDAAFFCATQELRLRAEKMGGDAVVFMSQDIDLDTNGFAHFYLQMYGTAVKYID